MPSISKVSLVTLSLFTVSCLRAEDICTQAQHGILVETETTARFNQKSELWRSMICSSSYEKYDQVQSGGGSLQIGIPDIINAQLGGTTNGSNYTERRNQFCKDETFDSSSNSNYYNTVNRVSKLAPAIIAACKGFTAVLVPSINFKQFTIVMTNNTPSDDHRITVEELNLPSGVQCKTYKPGKIYHHQALIGCEKSEGPTVQISGNTSSGTIGPVDVPGKDATLESIQQQIAALNAKLQRVEMSMKDELNVLKTSAGFEGEKSYADVVGHGDNTELKCEPGKFVAMVGTHFATDGRFVRLGIACRAILPDSKESAKSASDR